MTPSHAEGVGGATWFASVVGVGSALVPRAILTLDHLVADLAYAWRRHQGARERNTTSTSTARSLRNFIQANRLDQP